MTDEAEGVGRQVEWCMCSQVHTMYAGVIPDWQLKYHGVYYVCIFASQKIS